MCHWQTFINITTFPLKCAISKADHQLFYARLFTLVVLIESFYISLWHMLQMTMLLTFTRFWLCMCWPSEDLQISSDQGSDHVFFCVCAVYSCEDECSCVWLTLYLQIEARGWCQCWKSSLTILHFTFWKISHWTWIDLRLANQQAQGYFVSASLALGLQACATISGFYMGSKDLNSGPTLLRLELYRLSHLPNPLVVFFWELNRGKWR